MTKSGTKTIPLDRPVLEVPDNAVRIEGHSYVIVGTGEDAHLVDLQKPWLRARNAARLADLQINDWLLHQTGFRQHQRDHYGLGFKVASDLRMAETDTGPVVMVRARWGSYTLVSVAS